MGARSRPLGLLGAALGLLVLGAQAQPIVERVSFAPHPGGDVVRLHLSDEVSAFSAPRLDEHGVLELTLFNAGLAPAYEQEAPQGPVQSYEVAAEGGHLRFRFRLAPGAPAGAALYPDRATPDLLLRLGPTSVASTAPDARPARTAASGADVRIEHGAGGSAASVGERWRLDTIVIDAGHGGADDLGAVGAGGVREKDVTLAVARKLGAAFEEHLDVRVVYTREGDRAVSLPERGRIANEAGGKLFISLHANAARRRGAQGTETYFLGVHKGEAARRVMERENAVVQLESDPDYYAGFDAQAPIRRTLASSTYLRASERLASKVEAEFAERLGRPSRGVKQAGFYVLWGASMPAILIELGFLTNAGEAALLASEAGQDALASAIFRAVRDFKEADYEKGLNLSARP